MIRDNHHAKHISALQAFIAFLVVAVACGMLLLFTTYKDSIIASQNFQLFMVLVVAGSALLLTLLFLVNKPDYKHLGPSAQHRRKKRR